MNFIIMTEKKSPDAQPLVFICPDTVNGDDFEEQYPEETKDYYVTTVYGDQPTVVSDYPGILDLLKGGE